MNWSKDLAILTNLWNNGKTLVVEYPGIALGLLVAFAIHLFL